MSNSSSDKLKQKLEDMKRQRDGVSPDVPDKVPVERIPDEPIKQTKPNDLRNDFQSKLAEIKALTEGIDNKLNSGPVSRPVAPVAEPVIEPVVAPIVEPVIVVAPVINPVIEPVVEPIAETVIEPVIEPVVAPVIQPAIEPTVEPIVEPVIEPVVEPVVEPVIEPVIESTHVDMPEPTFEYTPDDVVEPEIETIEVLDGNGMGPMPDSFNEPRRRIITWPRMVGVLLALIALTSVAYVVLSMNAKPKVDVTQPSPVATGTAALENIAKADKKVEEVDTAPSKAAETVEDLLTEKAKKTTQPFKLDIDDIGGGYTLGVITYYPDDATKTYNDYTMNAPFSDEDKVSPLADDKTKSIEDKLKSDMPVINETIKVKDAAKVTMETYKQDKLYHTMLLYDGTPFAFVSTDDDDNMVNNVTTYYVQEVLND